MLELRRKVFWEIVSHEDPTLMSELVPYKRVGGK